MSQYLARGTTVAVLVVLLGIGMALGGGVALGQSGDPAIDWWVISGGGGPSSGTGVMLNDTLGQPVIGPSGDGSIALSAGYWVACVAAAAVMPVVTVAVADTNPADVVLTWDADPANAQYQVWVTTGPYFDPDHPGGVAPEVIPGLTYTDPGAATDPVNHFYVVRGLNACGAASVNSVRTGEFTFGLTPGSL